MGKEFIVRCFRSWNEMILIWEDMERYCHFLCTPFVLIRSTIKDQYSLKCNDCMMNSSWNPTSISRTLIDFWWLIRQDEQGNTYYSSWKSEYYMTGYWMILSSTRWCKIFILFIYLLLRVVIQCDEELWHMPFRSRTMLLGTSAFRTFSCKRCSIPWHCWRVFW